MVEIKILVAWFVGVVYASSWWASFTIKGSAVVLPITVTFVGTMVLSGVALSWLVDHWYD